MPAFMKKVFIRAKKILFCFLLLALYNSAGRAQDTALIHKLAPKVFIDCQVGCDMQYIQSKLPYINFVRDMRQSEVYIMITANSTGGGGRQFTCLCTDERVNKTDTVKFSVPPNNSESDTRELMLKKIKAILLPYLSVALAEFIEYNIPMPKVETTAKKDKWNSWIFNIGMNGFAGGNSYNVNINSGGNISMSRVTEKSKFDLVAQGSYNYQRFDISDKITTVERSGFGFYNRKAFSIGKNFSAGWFASHTSSTVTNLKGNTTFYPAFECNLFPYEQATHRVFRVIYRAGVRYQDYLEQTVYDSKYMWLYPHSLVVDFTQIEKWGTIDISLGGTHYFNMPENYNATFSPSVILNPFKGFRFSFWANISMVNDQFFLRKQSFTESQILLGQAALKTAYSFSAGVGFSYSFGSIYNNVVNVRFDMDRTFW
jgi:hypothetical protein